MKEPIGFLVQLLNFFITMVTTLENYSEAGHWRSQVEHLLETMLENYIHVRHWISQVKNHWKTMLENYNSLGLENASKVHWNGYVHLLQLRSIRIRDDEDGIIWFKH